MLYYNFNGYEGFKEVFGYQEHGNGVKSRRNKVLLSYIKNPQLLKEARETGDYSLVRISSMAELKQEMWRRIAISSKPSDSKPYTVRFMGRTLYSSRYETDAANGLCEDGDYKCIRYINHETNNGIYKMKAGKFIRNLILETDFGQTLNEQVMLYLCEDFTQEWEVYTRGQVPENKLFVNKEFGRIYSGKQCEGDFHSCMTSRGYHTFYRDAVNASAAYLQNEEGKVIARCVIYNECIDEEGKVWRLAERQYSTDCDDVLKRALVDALIREGCIDGYKQVGYDCHNSRGFVDIYGNSLATKKFHIECDLGEEDPLSYQDSFKWYDIRKRIAYNYEDEVPYDYSLDTTEGSIYGDSDEPECYDSYHDRYCYDVYTVYVNGREMTCDEDDMDDFEWIESLQKYIHYEEVSHCDECDSYYLTEDAVKSEITGESYCCEECKQKAELEYAQDNWTFSEYDQKYYENEDAVTTFMSWNRTTETYDVRTIAKKTLAYLLQTFRFLMMGDGQVYDEINFATWSPFEAALAEA